MNKNITIPIALVAVALLVLFLPVILLPYTVNMKSVENLTFESSENFMIKEEKWFYPLKGQVIPMGNETIPIGIAGQTYEINFGRIPQNSSTRKFINLNSSNPAKTELYVSGNITPFMIFPQSLYIKGEEKMEIAFNGTEMGNFTGTLLIRNIIPKNVLAERLMGLV